ncbi:MAG: DedA family protein [Chloroflexota bacterium]|nr:DedA family protein [Chloroflexota bacterium]
MHDLFAALAEWVTSTVKTGGYVGVGGLTLLENLFPPIPSELILPVAGFLVSTGELRFIWVVLAATLGSLAGALILYGLGYWLGEDRVRGLVKQHGHWLALDESDVDRTRDWFDRHGGKAVLIGRFVPTVRSLISIPAGVERMPLGRFALYTTVGSAGWNAVLVGAGWMLGDQWERIKPYMEVLEWGVLIALAAGVVWFVWQRKIRRDAPAQASGSESRPRGRSSL